MELGCSDRIKKIENTDPDQTYFQKRVEFKPLLPTPPTSEVENNIRKQKYAGISCITFTNQSFLIGKPQK